MTSTDNIILTNGVVGFGDSQYRPFFAQVKCEQTFAAESRAHLLPKLPSLISDALSYVSDDHEIYVGAWTIVSPNALRKRYDELGFAMFAHSYVGMGNVICLAYCEELDIVFEFEDGGANGFERLERYEFAKAMTQSDKRKRVVDLNLLLNAST